MACLYLIHERILPQTLVCIAPYWPAGQSSDDQDSLWECRKRIPALLAQEGVTARLVLGDRDEFSEGGKAFSELVEDFRKGLSGEGFIPEPYAVFRMDADHNGSFERVFRCDELCGLLFYLR
jgi:hypothetical protein